MTKRIPLLSFALPLALAAQSPEAPIVKEKPMPTATRPAESKTPAATHAPGGSEIKVCREVESRECKDAAASFKVSAGTKIWVWARVAAVPAGDYAIAFRKGDMEIFRQKLAVPSVPWRTQAYRTFRASDGGSWTAALVGSDGKDVASSSFTVEMTP
jgi:hypothetical protein